MKYYALHFRVTLQVRAVYMYDSNLCTKQLSVNKTAGFIFKTYHFQDDSFHGSRGTYVARVGVAFDLFRILSRLSLPGISPPSLSCRGLDNIDMRRNRHV